MAVALYHGGGNAAANGASATAAASPASGGSNVVAIAKISWGVTKAPTSVQWDGTNMTEIGTVISGTGMFTRAYELANPARDGTSKNLVISWSGTTRYAASIVFYSDVDQTTPTDGEVSDTSTGVTTVTATVTSATDSLAAWVGGHTVNNNRVTPGSGENERHDHQSGGGGANINGWQGDEAGAASVTADFTFSSANVAYKGFNIRQAAVSGRIMSSLIGAGGMVSHGGLAGQGGGLIG
jgi:hypothetical protein